MCNANYFAGSCKNGSICIAEWGPGDLLENAQVW